MPLSVQVRRVRGFVQMVHTRMPFRYGSARLVECPHLYVVLDLQDQQGREASGIASDNLPPRWFDKDPGKSYTREVTDQLAVFQRAVNAIQAAGTASPFDLWRETYRESRTGAGDLPVLLTQFGPSLVERALLDAVGRLLNLPLHALLRSEALGTDLGSLDPSQAGVSAADLLPPAPQGYVYARHTVGLGDPIRTADIPPEDRVNDGLSQSLDEVIAFYGVRYFKIKISNNLEEDRDRLIAIASLLDERLPGESYACTLDGNEQYDEMAQLLPLLEALEAHPASRRLLQSVLFLEQPLHRAAAFDLERCRGIERLRDRFPVIIDESDDRLDAFPRALELGYGGTSHKNCKGIFKSLLNLGRCRLQERSGRTVLLSAEDLTNIGIIALNQDLTALSTLGITHAERNGHHYFRGLSHLPPEDQARALAAYPELYTEGEGTARLSIRGGQIDVRTLHTIPGLGCAIWPTFTGLTPVERFNPVEALG